MKYIILLLLFGTVAIAADNVLVSKVSDHKNNETIVIQAGSSLQTYKIEPGNNESTFDNSIYIEQAGNNQFISINNSGSENRIESYQTGDRNHATIQMAGNSSKTIKMGELQLESAVMVKQDGNDNSAEINIETGNGNGAVIYQQGDESIASILQKEGGQNRAWIEQRDHDQAMIVQTGNANTAQIIQR